MMDVSCSALCDLAGAQPVRALEAAFDLVSGRLVVAALRHMKREPLPNLNAFPYLPAPVVTWFTAKAAVIFTTQVFWSDLAELFVSHFKRRLLLSRSALIMKFGPALYLDHGVRVSRTCSNVATHVTQLTRPSCPDLPSLTPIPRMPGAQPDAMLFVITGPVPH